MITREQNTYKFNKEKLQILRRIAKTFKPKNILRVDIP